MNEHFTAFKHFTEEMIETVCLDLEAMEKIAESAGSTTSITVRTTIRPGDEHLHQVEEPKISRCTVPIAMVCFSVLDMVGQWVNDFKDDDFGHSASAFFTKLASRDDLKNTGITSRFKEVFRNGLTHSFFPKKGFSIAYNYFQGNSLFSNFHGDQTTLDIKYLLNVVRAGLAALKEALQDKDSELCREIFEGYKGWLERQ